MLHWVAIVVPASTCAARNVLFQVQTARSWGNLKTRKVDNMKCAISITAG